MDRRTSEKTLLVFNCHEAWVYQLGTLGLPLDIVVGLDGRHTEGWDLQMRPLPTNARLIRLDDALAHPNPYYYCIITHNVADLMQIKHRSEPRLLVIHSTIEGRRLEERSQVEPERMRQTLRTYLTLVGGHAVAVSALKGRSWGFTEDIAPFCADLRDYRSYTGDWPCGLRICNFISSRRNILMWDFHEQAFAGLPVKLVGHNPDLPGVRATEDWEQLKAYLQSHRFYIHTADPSLEDGYNMATMEAMAAGMPILGNKHPSSPVEHGVSGFLSDDPQELNAYARTLLEDRDLAVRMGQAAQSCARRQFSVEGFRQKFLRSIEVARAKSSTCTAPATMPL
ncbi:MAG TPA: glycosyltransferase family 1 protein [Phycisphaerales bacterium]|nr:glycosyltransferase family 1 protein [Phycisphaerales bacterium]